MYSLFFGLYDSCVKTIKNKINDYFISKPETGLVENNLFLLLEHTSFLVLGLALFWNESWLFDITQIWESNIDYKVIIYYYFYTTRYIVQTKMLSRKDKGFITYFIHHITTILLLIFSFQKFNRIGIIIGINHDVADIPLLTAKILHKTYESRDIEIYNYLSKLCFILFIPVFFITRIYLNSDIIYYLTYSKHRVLSKGFYDFYICYNLLYLNLILQIFWQIVIVKFAYNMFFGLDAIDEKDGSYMMSKKK